MERNEQECLCCRYIGVIDGEEGIRRRLTWRDVALRYIEKMMETPSVPQHASANGHWMV